MYLFLKESFVFLEIENLILPDAYTSMSFLLVEIENIILPDALYFHVILTIICSNFVFFPFYGID